MDFRRRELTGLALRQVFAQAGFTKVRIFGSMCR